MMNKKLSKYEDMLIDVILELDNREEAKKFFRDLCTENEIVLLEQRFAVAKMLSEQKTYQDICDVTGASTATISRVSRALNSGEDGYNAVIDRLKKNAKA